MFPVRIRKEKHMQSLCVNTGAEYLKKINLAIEKEDLTLPLALGGMKNGFSLNELIGGYTALARKGVYSDLSFISKVRINGVCVHHERYRGRMAWKRRQHAHGTHGRWFALQLSLRNQRVSSRRLSTKRRVYPAF